MYLANDLNLGRKSPYNFFSYLYLTIYKSDINIKDGNPNQNLSVIIYDSHLSLLNAGFLKYTDFNFQELNYTKKI